MVVHRTHLTGLVNRRTRVRVSIRLLHDFANMDAHRILERETKSCWLIIGSMMGDHQLVVRHHCLMMGDHRLVVRHHCLMMGDHRLVVCHHCLMMGDHRPGGAPSLPGGTSSPAGDGRRTSR
ncbi:MAG TPA: hypothetical protein VNM90_28130 [Haliangium sp.]|nr:hypothetical protein [Haliangium sp.]